MKGGREKKESRLGHSDFEKLRVPSVDNLGGNWIFNQNTESGSVGLTCHMTVKKCLGLSQSCSLHLNKEGTDFSVILGAQKCIHGVPRVAANRLSSPPTQPPEHPQSQVPSFLSFFNLLNYFFFFFFFWSRAAWDLT